MEDKKEKTIDKDKQPDPQPLAEEELSESDLEIAGGCVFTRIPIDEHPQ